MPMLAQQFSALRQAFLAEQERTSSFFSLHMDSLRRLEIEALNLQAERKQHPDKPSADPHSPALLHSEASRDSRNSGSSLRSVPKVNTNAVAPVCVGSAETHPSMVLDEGESPGSNAVKVWKDDGPPSAPGSQAQIQSHDFVAFPVVTSAPAPSSITVNLVAPTSQLAVPNNHSPLRKSISQMREQKRASALMPAEAGTQKRPSALENTMHSFQTYIQTSPILFENAESQKCNVRHQIVEEEIAETDLYDEEGRWQAIAKHPVFDMATSVAILANTIWIAVDTDYNEAILLSEANVIFQVVEHFFCTVFVTELLLRFMAFQVKWHALKNLGFLFDGALVSFMVLEVWILTLIGTWLKPDEGGDTHRFLTFIPVLRLFRLLRVARMARLLRLMPEQMLLITGLGSAIRTVGSVLSLIVLLTYVLSILVTQISSGKAVKDKYFKSVGYSMQTMLRNWVLEDHHYIIKQVASEDFLCCVILIIFVVLGALTAMHMLIGVLAHSVLTMAEIEIEKADCKKVKDAVVLVLIELDSNEDGTISPDEMNAIKHKPHLVNMLTVVGVDVHSLVDYAHAIFAHNIEMTYEQVCELCLELREGQFTRVKHILDLRKFISHEFSQLSASIDSRRCLT